VQALRECLYHNPDSEPARRGLERLGAHVGTAPLPELEEAVHEPEPEPQPEPEPEPETTLPSEPQTERVPLIPEPSRSVRVSEPESPPPARRPSPGLRAAGYIIAALVGAIVLGYVGLLVAGFPVITFTDFQDALSDTTGLIALVVGLVVGGAVGILVVRALSTRPRSAR
jgi:hypothetical protein